MCYRPARAVPLPSSLETLSFSVDDGKGVDTRKIKGLFQVETGIAVAGLQDRNHNTMTMTTTLRQGVPGPSTRCASWSK